MSKKVSLDEIKRRLIADAGNPDAWEPVGVVGPSKSRRPAWYGKSGASAPRQPSKSVSIDDARAKRRASAAVSPDVLSREAAALRRKQLHDAVAALPEGQRQVIQLWLDGFHYTDIARALRLSVVTVKSRLRDAKRQLRLEGDSGSGDNILDDRVGGAKGR